ncbi:hypothetical protein ERJ75_001245300 [Trypanosoma vivax]|nr:hypothetical protein TRVL_04692 [Trypanosoma vivax]KAH8609029.1 hypothetical protein ERJ75_001245300 [Trypanosoma vivax]
MRLGFWKRNRLTFIYNRVQGSVFHAARTISTPPPRFATLPTSHAVFGQKQAALPAAPRKRPLLAVDHPVFGRNKMSFAEGLFNGRISVSGFFLAIDPNVAAGSRSPMNPNAQITVCDEKGNMSRIRYRCHLESHTGLQLEALIRLQVGWISPKITFTSVPYVIHLGRGFDVSVPFLIHFTMVSILDERGNSTGSCLYFSGTPLLGFSAGIARITGGKLVLDPSKNVNPAEEAKQFVGRVHVRQLGFVMLKILTYFICLVACIPATQHIFQRAATGPPQ